MRVSVLVKNLYIVFASAMGLWFVSKMDRLFCKVVLLGLFSRRLVFVLVCNSAQKLRIGCDGS